ncbi:MAG: FkbM family methyltransferase [Gemmatimonadota bacterium]
MTGTALRSRVAGAIPARAFAALMRGIYPRVETELACINSWAPRGGTAVDVGAWYGPWTARLTKLADQVVTIEPNPELARLIQASFPACRVVEAAASDSAGMAQLWLPDGGRGADGVASLEHPTNRSISVPRVTIDSLGLADVRFIKMDIEGHEAAALRGAEQTIKRDSPLLLLELESRHQRIEDVIAMLREWGYQGHVRPGRSWLPLTSFDLAAHQQSALHVAERGLLGRLARPGARYVNLVLFSRHWAGSSPERSGSSA